MGATIGAMSGTATESIGAYIQAWTPRIETELRRLLPPESEEPTVVHRAMRHSVLAGGKRLRPLLVLLGARAAGGAEESVLGPACAVEFIHTYSLIHDDLPAMDDDDFRRGQPSCHKAFGEAMAILAGDALHTLAFAVIAKEAPDPGRVADLVTELATASGTAGMVGGQVADLEGEGGEADPDLVRFIHERKTGALLTASLRLGALAVGAESDVLDCLGAYGRRVGLAFQIVDDLLDEEGEAGDLGKTPGKDREAGKLTYPAALGAEESRRLAESLIHEAVADVGPLPAAALLRGLAARVLSRRR